VKNKALLGTAKFKIYPRHSRPLLASQGV